MPLLVIELQFGGTEQVLQLVERSWTANRRGHSWNSEKPGESHLGSWTTTTGRNGRGCIYDSEVALDRAPVSSRLLQFFARQSDTPAFGHPIARVSAGQKPGAQRTPRQNTQASRSTER
jgi:hypothetical protein